VSLIVERSIKESRKERPNARDRALRRKNRVTRTPRHRPGAGVPDGVMMTAPPGARGAELGAEYRASCAHAALGGTGTPCGADATSRWPTWRCWVAEFLERLDQYEVTLVQTTGAAPSDVALAATSGWPGWS